MLKHHLLAIALTTIGCASIEELNEPIPYEDGVVPKAGFQDELAKADSMGENSGPIQDETNDQADDIDADDGPDACLAFGYYENGVCDTFCLRPDPECEATGETGETDQTDNCLHTRAVPDGYCELACETQDPDCKEADTSWTLDEGLMLVCSRFSLPELVEELAESICIQAPPEHFDTCVESCLMRYENG